MFLCSTLRMDWGPSVMMLSPSPNKLKALHPDLLGFHGPLSSCWALVHWHTRPNQHDCVMSRQRLGYVFWVCVLEDHAKQYCSWFMQPTLWAFRTVCTHQKRAVPPLPSSLVTFIAKCLAARLNLSLSVSGNPSSLPCISSILLKMGHGECQHCAWKQTLGMSLLILEVLLGLSSSTLNDSWKTAGTEKRTRAP